VVDLLDIIDFLPIVIGTGFLRKEAETAKILKTWRQIVR
jgi:hypothetical protein